MADPAISRTPQKAKASIKLTVFLLMAFSVSLEKFKSQLAQHCESVKK